MDAAPWQDLAPCQLIESMPVGMRPATLDLSIHSTLHSPEISLAAIVEARRTATKSHTLYGGYLEHRAIYDESGLFEAETTRRNIHLGLDFWTAAGTTVFAPLAGTVHSFQDNAHFKDYGPTIILQHTLQGQVFHTLYGHLSRPSLAGLSIGQAVACGDRLGTLGDSHENGEWPPHLHFQLILDMQGKTGDYPGVCAAADLPFYRLNCPDPSRLLWK